MWKKPAALAGQYPPTIGCSAEDKVSGLHVDLVARRTGQVEDGCEVYEVRIPMPGAWMAAGRVVLNFDLVPGMATMNLLFEGLPA